LFTDHTAPELLYLEARWASLVSFGMTTTLLKDVLPIAVTTNPETVRQHLHQVAARQDADLGGEPASLVDRDLVSFPGVEGVDGCVKLPWRLFFRALW